MLALFAAGCVAAPPAGVEAAPRHLLASIRILESAFKGPISAKQGFFFYTHEEPGIAGPTLEGYEFRGGKQVDEFGGGSDSAKVIEAISRVGLQPFDFEQEVEAVTAGLRKESERRGEWFLEPQARDGAKWEVIISTGTGMFTLTAWNPRVVIDAYAPHSENIAKLKAVLDLLAQYYGQLIIGP